MFKFEPVYKELIWGGQNILPLKGLPADSRKIGESWELSGVEGNKSTVSEGFIGKAGTNDKGKTIDELIAEYGERLLGRSIMEKTGTTFPILVKFIDAQDDLSIQVHPADDLAIQRHNSFGKTEMWYVVHARTGASLYSGFSCRITPEEYVERVENNTITEVLQHFEVKAGDVFFLPAGRIHAIGKGCLIAEIQQTSNITYRIYDYDRRDANGNRRELHSELAKDAIDYTVYPDYKTHYETNKNSITELVKCRYFNTGLLDARQTIIRFLNADSFVIYTCLSGEAVIINNYNYRMHIRQGEVVLIPAETPTVTIKTGNHSVKLLETYIPQ
ncbi:MAG: class I mannose-6-phosphate isomerase [Tannerella sp.]|jgi:mannose-6-phosphate isomerase|nr:class I mannose-6-phosphate isomerase [Tannerella sp.]